MSDNNNKLLAYNAERLGLQDTPAPRKADEYLRVLQSKGAVTATVSDTARTVLCLDLAAATLGLGFDKETARKLAGLRPAAYQNTYNTLQTILQLNRPITVAELCVQFSCTVVKELAVEILTRYAAAYDGVDAEHPQYAAAAVYTACTLNNIKLRKLQFSTASRLKNAQWIELTNEFLKFAKTTGLANAKTKQGHQSFSSSQDIVDISSGLKSVGEKSNNNQKELNNESTNIVEDYDVWRERILKEARLELQTKKS